VSDPTSVNAAAPAGQDVTTGNLADGTPSIWTNLVNTLQSFATLSPDVLAQAWGMWTAARAAIQTVASGVAAAATQDTVDAAMTKYTPTKLTPAVLADMAVRNIIGSESGSSTAPILGNIDGHDIYTEASYAGIDLERMNALILDTGESYGILDALRLYNRGTSMPVLTENTGYPNVLPLYVSSGNQATEYGITEDELNTVIYYSRVRDQFIPDLLKLARNTLTPADAVELALKDVVSDADAMALFTAGGGVPEQFHVLVDGAGDAIGVEKAVEMAAHNVISAETLNAVIHMSRMNPRFYPLAEQLPDGTYPLNTKWLPPFEIKEAATAGTITSAQALQWMLDSGYPEDQAKAFAGSLVAPVVTTAKHETAAMVLEEYQASMISDDQATAALTSLGYTTAAVPFLLQYAQAKQVIAGRNTAMARIRQGFLSQLVTADQATTELRQVGIQQAAVTTLISDWTAELAVPHTALTVAEIGWFVEHAVISAAEAQSLWKMKGLTATDAALMAQRYPAPAPTTPAVPAGSGGQ
jgi:hypothetical protein